MDAGKAEDHYECLESQRKVWDMLLRKSEEYGNRKCLDANDEKRDPGAMDTSSMGILDHIDAMHLSAPGKGKGEVKGTYVLCYMCGDNSHIADDCPAQNPHEGYCGRCGVWGHDTEDCKAEKAKRKGKDRMVKEGEGKVAYPVGEEEPNDNTHVNDTIGETGGLDLGGASASPML